MCMNVNLLQHLNISGNKYSALFLPRAAKLLTSSWINLENFQGVSILIFSPQKSFGKIIWQQQKLIM